MSIESKIQKASILEKKGAFEPALAAYGEILEKFPNNRRAKLAFLKLHKKHRNPSADQLGVIKKAIENEDWSSTILACRQLIATFPDSEILWDLTGKAAIHLNHLDVAASAFIRAFEIDKSAKYCISIAQILDQVNAPSDAAHWYSEAHKHAPNDAEILRNCAISQYNAQDFPAAITSFEKYLKRNKSDAYIHTKLGEACLQSKQYKKAAVAFKNAIKYAPTEAMHYANLSLAYRALGDFDEAIKIAKKSVHLDSKNIYSMANLASLYSITKQNQHAADIFDKTYLLDTSRIEFLERKLYVQTKICDWGAFSQYDEAIKTHPRLGANTPWASINFKDDPEHQLFCSKVFASKVNYVPTKFERPNNARMRIGYFTSDLYEHATMHLITGVLEQHDKNDFEIYLYALNPPQKSDLAERAKKSATVFRDIHDCDDHEIQQIAKQDKLDIAIDLKGYTKDGRFPLFSAGLAPIQVSYLGYPSTSGEENIDYLIADQTLIPPKERPYYSEKIIHLPNSYQPTDDQRVIPNIADSRLDHGLPQDACVLCCFNNPYKISPREFDIWMRILTAFPNTVLWLMDPGEDGRRNLEIETKKRHVDFHRIIFAQNLPQGKHLARYRHADLFVDTFHYNAHTTASDALWAGLPLITMAGRQFAARVGASILNAMQLPELITQSPTEYETLISEYVNDPKRLNTLRKKVEANRYCTPMFDTKAYTRDLEEGYRQAIHTYKNEQPPRDIHV